MSAGRLLAVSEVHVPLRDGRPWLAVLAEMADGLRVIGLGRGRLSVGDAVTVVDDESGVAVFSRAGEEAR